MDAESHFLAALELTRQMAAAGELQDWPRLGQLQVERAELLKKMPLRLAELEKAAGPRVAELIREILHQEEPILERVKVAQDHVRILLRLEQP